MATDADCLHFWFSSAAPELMQEESQEEAGKPAYDRQPV